MAMRGVLKAFLAATFVAPLPAAASALPAGARVTAEPGSVRVEYVLPPFSLATAPGASALAPYRSSRITVPGLVDSTAAGLPALPSQGLFVALPPGASA